ncbi:MAG: SPOR domain-containing protein [Pseudomonadota bacterium]
MNQALKNRIVGVVLLMALAVIVLPLIFDGANEQTLLADTRMPPAPQVPDAMTLLAETPAQLPEAEGEIAREHQAALPEVPVIPPVAVAPEATRSASSDTPPAVPVAGGAPAVEPFVAADPRLTGLAQAWDVQVTAVAAPEGAERLRAKLVQAGYKARVHRVDGLFKVLVGPELRREDAQSLQRRLGADVRVGKPQTVLVRYVP